MPLLNFSRRLWLIYLVYSAIVCGGFAVMGFPMPHSDDPAYIGTAEHLAKTGQLDNPYMRNCLIPYDPEKYFGQFPTYTFLLAAWMKIAGFSLCSILIFYFLANFLNCICAAFLFQRLKLPALLCLFFPWMLISFAQTQGFRPDVTGLCAFWISLILLTYRTVPAFLAASFFGSMAMLLWPVIIGFVAPAFVVRLVLLWKSFPSSERLKKILPFCAAVALGAAISFFSFLLMIGFELSSFLHDFLMVAAMRRPAGSSIVYAFLGLSWTNYNHFFLFSVLLLLGFMVYWATARQSFLSSPVRIWLLETCVGFILATLLYAVNLQLIYFFFWLAVITVAADLARTRAKRELMVVAFLSCGLWIQAVSDAKRLLPMERQDLSLIAADLKKNSHGTLIFDEISYRYLFDMQPPSGSRAWIWARPSPAIGARLSDKKPEETWIISEKWLNFFDTGKGGNKLVLIR